MVTPGEQLGFFKYNGPDLALKQKKSRVLFMNKLHFWNLATILNIRSSIPLASSGDAQVSKLDEIEHF